MAHWKFQNHRKKLKMAHLAKTSSQSLVEAIGGNCISDREFEVGTLLVTVPWIVRDVKSIQCWLQCCVWCRKKDTGIKAVSKLKQFLFFGAFWVISGKIYSHNHVSHYLSSVGWFANCCENIIALIGNIFGRCFSLKTAVTTQRYTVCFIISIILYLWNISFKNACPLSTLL